MHAHITTTADSTAVARRPWVRTSAMVIGFAIVMMVSNAIAAMLREPITALLIGPLLAALALLLYRFAVRRVEGRTASDLAPEGAARLTMIGFGGGILLAAVTIGAIAALGGYRITGWGSLSGALTVVGIMCAIAVAEEVLFRGVVFRLVQGRGGTWPALAVSAVLFGLVHLVNPGATVWGAVAVAIEAGLMLGAAYAATGSLWLPIGLHLGWNIALVGIFGSVTSGSEMAGSLLQAATDGPAWLTGGSFGPEGSIFAVLFCSGVTVALLAVAHRRGRLVSRRR